MGDTFDPRTISWVTTKADLSHLVKRALDGDKAVVFDLETTGLDEHARTHGQSNGGVAARVVLASYTIPDGTDSPRTYLVPLSHPDSPWLGQWRKVLRIISQEMRGMQVIGHNVKYDCRWIKATTGVDLAPSIAWDTQLSSHLLDENNTTKLKEVAPKTFGVNRWDDVDLKTPGAAEKEPLFKLGEYAARDTYWTWRLWVNHYSRMVPAADEPPIGTEEIEEARLGMLMRNVVVPTSRTLTAIEQRGIQLDEDWVKKILAELEETYEESKNELAQRYPELDPEGASFAPTSKWFQEWSNLAVQREDLRISAMTPTGKPQWSKTVLVRQARAGSEVAEKLLTLRDAAKRSEFLRAWLSLQTDTGRIHANYNMGSVVSGRLSSSNPNMQQCTKSLKPAFTPAPGYYLAEIDYSQIELRVAAFISGCAPMIEAFKRGDDLHKLIAARVNDKDPDQVTKAERQQGKAMNFGLLYGMGSTGFREYASAVYGVEMSEQEAAQAHQAYFDMWDGLRSWHAREMNRAHRTGQVMSPIGRIRHLHDTIWDRNPERVSGAERMAVNSPVQGFASDIMQTAAAIIEGMISGYPGIKSAHIVGTVHDSILVEVPQDDWEKVTRECKSVMEKEVPHVLAEMGVEFNVPLVADATVGTRWGMDDVGEL